MAAGKPEQKIGDFWDQQFASYENLPQQWMWWDSCEVLRYIGRMVCSYPCTSFADINKGVMQERFAEKLPFKHGLSVGCGLGRKEACLVKDGLVEQMTLYDFSPVALKAAQASFAEVGHGDAVRLVQGDAFALERGHFDFVYWDNALHHMPDVHVALLWSRSRLKPGGVLSVNDFVGPSRFQWSDEFIDACNQVLHAFSLPLVIRPERKALIKKDPSEAADSDRIHEALFRFFPKAQWIPTGGAIYNVGLTGRVRTIPDALLELLLHFDAKLNAAGMYVYAHATAVKE